MAKPKSDRGSKTRPSTGAIMAAVTSPAPEVSASPTVTRLYMRMRLAAAFALILGVVLVSHLSISATRNEVRIKIQISEALSSARAGISAIELGLHDLIVARDVWRAEESRSGIRSGRAQLAAAVTAIEQRQAEGALNPQTSAILLNPILRPLEKMTLMLKLSEPLIDRDGPLGPEAKRYSTLAIDVSKVVQPALVQMRRNEYSALIAANVALASRSLILVILCLASLAFSAVFIFRPLERRVIDSQEMIMMKTRAVEAAAEAKSRFLATMSHEIRTPMNGVLGMAEIMRFTRLDEKQAKMLEIIQSSGKLLVNLLDDILDLSKLEANAMSFEREPFDLRVIAGECASLFQPIAASKSVRLDHAIDPDVARTHLGDEKRLRQILTNLLSNAVKFTDQGGVIVRVAVRETLGQDQVLSISVTDSGIGVPKALQSRIFDGFEQGDSSTTRRYGGTGLGLAIVRQLVVGMGGEIAVESVVGRGSTFTVTLALPIAQGAASASDHDDPSPEDPPRPVNALRVLVVDDNEVNRLVARSMLERIGCEVLLAERGEAALAAMGDFGPKLVLMDVSMPGMGGLEAARRIRALDLRPRPLIYGFSALVAEADRVAGLAAGFDGFLTKPIDISRLRAVVAPADDASGRSAGEGVAA